MKENKHFKKFFICPNCKSPLARKGALEYLKNDKYCRKCGLEIANAIKEAMASKKIAAISFEPTIKIMKTAEKEDIHLKVKVNGNENVSKEELIEVQKEIAVAIKKINRNRNKRISYKIVIQTPLSDGKALPEDYDMQQKKPSYRQKHL